MDDLLKFIKLSSSSPSAAFNLLKAFLRGFFHILYYKVFQPRVSIRYPFFMYGKFGISGPGRVFIDKYCSIFPNMFKGVSIVTLAPNAAVRIGKNCSLGGVTIRCREKVEMGDKTMVGHSLIQDSLFSECTIGRENIDNQGRLSPREIRIGRNVWIGAQSCILSGTTIGDDSVVSLGTVCYGADIKEYHLATGNLSIRSIPIAKLIKLQEVRQ